MPSGLTGPRVDSKPEWLVMCPPTGPGLPHHAGAGEVRGGGCNGCGGGKPVGAAGVGDNKVHMEDTTPMFYYICFKILQSYC